jgi:hypothetical protein
MGLYTDRVLPRLINVMCGMEQSKPLRRRVCADLSGDVVEIGFGSGLNLPFYPTTVQRVAAVEPADLAWKLAGKRLPASHLTVDRAGLDGQDLPFDDDSFDCAVSAWTMTRPIVDLVEQSGFTIKELDTFYEEGAPKPMAATSLGVAAA